MHISLEDQGTGKESTICIDRKNGRAEIVNAQPEHVRHLISIAKAIGAEQVTVVITAHDREAWEQLGFHSTGLQVMVYDL